MKKHTQVADKKPTNDKSKKGGTMARFTKILLLSQEKL